MNRRFLVSAGLALVGGVTVVALLRWHYQKDESVDLTQEELFKARLKLQGNAPMQTVEAAPLRMSQTVRLAIGSLGFANDDLNRAVADLATAQLTGASGLELVERQSLDRVLGELQLTLSGFVRAKDALTAGKLLRADWFLLGTEVAFGGTNSIVLRIVDARTGILRDAGVIAADGAPAQIATDIAGFVRLARQTAAKAQPRVYLAIGTFEDLSLNNRRADFPTQLRGYLMARYMNSSQVSLLEREYVDTLLQEVRLDLAGLTEASTNPPQPMQSAFWLVTGQYQSYETSDLQVELLLNVQRIFGRHKRTNLRGLPDALPAQAKSAIDDSLKATELVIPTRTSEARAQMELGKDIQQALIHVGFLPNSFDLIDNDFGGGWDQAQALARQDPSVLRRERNLKEAIRAFKTVLLLDPDNRDAKLHLAICLRDPTIGQWDEARDYYREIIEHGPEDQSSDVARRALVFMFEREGGPAAAAAWFRSAAGQVSDPRVADFYRQQAEAAQKSLQVQRGGDAKAEQLAEQRLFEGMKAFKNMELLGIALTNWPFQKYHGYRMGMYDYAKTFGDDKAKAAQKLVELFPKMKSQAPELEPYLLASIASFQVDTNAAILADFERSLAFVIEHPDQLLNISKYWQDVRWEVGDWCFEKTNYDLAIKVFEGELRAAKGGHANLAFSDEDKLRLVYAYIGTHRWSEALDLVQTFSNQTVRTAANDGPWGRGWRTVRTDEIAAFCRQKLGLTPSQDPRQFEMGPNCVCMHTPSAFLTDADGIWLAIAGQLIRVDFNLHTNGTVSLPVAPDVPINCLRMGRNKIWIGTGGAGLVECDKTDLRCRTLTIADGLILNSVADVFEAGDLLWIGYGREAEGGVTQLDLHSRKTKSFMRSLIDNRAEPPPRIPGSGWEPAPHKRGEFAYRFAEDRDRWIEGVDILQTEIEIQTVLNGSEANHTNRAKVALTEEELDQLRAELRTNAGGRIITGVGSAQPKAALEVYNLRDHSWQTIIDTDAIPYHPTALLLVDNEVWAGGVGFIARVNLRENKVQSFCRIKADSVERIQLGGGYVWAQFDRHLHRAKVP